MEDASAAYAAMGQFNETLIYERTASASALQTDMTVIREFDREAERQSKIWGWRTAFGSFGLLGGIVVTFIGFANDYVPVAIAAMVVGAISLGVAIYCGRHYGRWARRNIENRRYELLADVLRHLACDIAPESPCKVRLDGNEYHKLQYLSENDDQTLRASGAKSYRLPWLELSGQFVDGQRFELIATQLVKRKERRKRKYTKVKEALVERVELHLRCKPQKYARWNDLPAVLKQLRLELPLQFWDLKVTGERVTLTGLMPRAVKVSGRGTSGSLDPGMLNSHAALGLFALVYRGLEEVRK